MFMCSAIILPTGTIGNINIKIILLIMLLFIVVYDNIKKNSVSEIFIASKYLLFIVVILLTWLDIGVIKANANEFYGFLQFKDFLATIIVTLIGYYFYKRKLFDWNYYFRLTLFAHLSYIVLKVVIFTAVLLNYVTLYDVIAFVKNIFGYPLITFNFSGGIIERNVARLDLLNDSLSPFLLLYVLNIELFGIQIKRSSKYGITVLLILNILIGYKRSLIIVSIVGVLYSILFVANNISRFKTIFITSAIITILYINYHEEINYFVTDRFNSNSQDYSDTIRREQFHVLKNEFYDNYLIGKGMGGYAYNYIRSEDLPYSYEMQWMQFLMQFGIFGFIFVLITYCSIIVTVIVSWVDYNPKIRSILLLSFILWGLMSFTNPMMLSSFCSVFYTLILLTALEFRTSKHVISRGSCN